MDERMKQMQGYLDIAAAYGASIGIKIVGAIILWVIGRIVIRTVLGVIERSRGMQKLEPTVVRYALSALSALFTILLVISVLSVFGVETATFAGLLAGVGIAVGMAWSGLLSNLAAGVFMMVLRPFKAGDFVTVGGVTGTVQSIGLFVTAIDTPDNVRTFVGNSKAFGDTIQNFSTNAFRRVDCVAQLAHGADHRAAIQLLNERLAALPHVSKEPRPQVEILEFTLAGPVLTVRAFCHTDHYWTVYFAMNQMIREELGTLQLPIPSQHLLLQQPPPPSMAA